MQGLFLAFLAHSRMHVYTYTGQRFHLLHKRKDGWCIVRDPVRVQDGFAPGIFPPHAHALAPTTQFCSRMIHSPCHVFDGCLFAGNYLTANGIDSLVSGQFQMSEQLEETQISSQGFSISAEEVL